MGMIHTNISRYKKNTVLTFCIYVKWYYSAYTLTKIRDNVGIHKFNVLPRLFNLPKTSFKPNSLRNTTPIFYKEKFTQTTLEFFFD